VRAICADELGWDDARWAREEVDYRVLWRSHYGVPRALP
jgi:glycerol-3-phosphate dehydrogenase